MAITRWEPLRGMEDLLDRYTRSMAYPFGRSGDVVPNSEWCPRVDIVEMNHAFKIKAEIPGVKKEDVHVTLAELTRQKAGLDSRLIDATRALSTASIRSPISGSVVATSLNHPGQVLSAGEVIARLAPLHAPMEAKVVVPAQSIGKIRVGQKTYLRVTGCPYSEFGLMTGKVTAISADALQQTKTNLSGPPAYEVSVQPSTQSLKRGNDRCDFRLGMDLQADVMTGRNTVMTFFLRKLRLMARV